MVEVKGKLTIPATFEGHPVYKISPTFGGKWNRWVESSDGIKNGSNITHIFCEKVDGLTNLRVIPP